MKLGIILGFCLGAVFVVCLKSLINEIRWRMGAKRERKTYIGYIRDNNLHAPYLLILSKIGLYWLINSKIFAFFSYLVKIVLIIVFVGLLVFLLIVNGMGYSEIFETRW